MATLDDVRAWQAQDRKEKHHSNWKRWYTKIKLQVLAHYSGGTPECACCGERAIPFLGLDHIVPVGGKRNRGPQYSKIVTEGYPDGYQVLCHNCNQAKGTGKRCPVHNS